ncbi:helix-turn-helix domain-containing protein [Lysinibacillus capsici]|uniref:helix-turn-helix domain-containing protein n=1 Tax=Lysinibacillus capsici TaxID=2115968 RepID=UPI002E2336B9|nr:helix-turn-helix domain-containing protein [Lysinibacillus capsici]
MEKNILGTEISKLRKEMSLTQKQLCEGICTQPTISMIENGSIIPSLDILTLIALKLKKPLEYFTDILLFNNYDYLKQFVFDIEELTLKQNFESVHNIVKKELKNNKHEEWFRTFLHWQLYLSSFHLKFIAIDEAIINIKNLLNKTPKIILQKYFLNIRMLNTIAFLYALKKDYKNSILYFNKINEIYKPDYSRKLNEDVYYLRIQYNRAKTLYDMGEYDLAISSCLQGIKNSLSLENMSIIGNFYYYLGQCYEKQNYHKDQISIMYQKALFFFDTLNRNLYSQILRKEKSQYLRNIVLWCNILNFIF